MDTKDTLALDATDLVERAMQAGRDEMATALGNLLASQLAELSEDTAYRDGVDDALCLLIQHGATDPRKD